MESPTAKPRYGRWCVIVAAILWSTSGFFAKAPWFEDWPIATRGIQLAFWRALFATLVALPFVRRVRWSWKLAPMAVTFLLMNIAYLNAMPRTTAANAIWLQNTAPFWVFLIGVFVFHEPLHRRDAVRLCLAGIGVGLILLFELGGNSPEGTLLGLASGLTYAGVVLALRRLRDFDAAFLIAFNHAVTAVALLPLVIWFGVQPKGIQWPALAGFGMLQMGIPYVLFAFSLKSITSHEASGLTLLEPILVPVWVFLAWHTHSNYQSPQWWTLVGGAFILAGLVVRYFGANDNRSDE